MLTIEILKADPTLKDVAAEKLQRIAELSKNDETSVLEKKIGEKVKEIHSQYDADIKAITGIAKPDGVKTYENLKTVLAAYKAKAEKGGKVEELTQTITDQKSQIATLQAQIKSGNGDAALKTQVEQLTVQLNDSKSELSTYKATIEKEKGELAKKLEVAKGKTIALELQTSINSFLQTKGVKFNPAIGKELLQETLDNRRAGMIQGLKTDYIDNGEGGQMMVFRDDKGEIKRNPKNALKPYTAGELFLEKISDLLQTSQSGGGTNGGGSTGDKVPTILDLTGAGTQVKADQIIAQHLMKNEGLTKTDPNFLKRQVEIRNENKVADLPME